jgi:hypothetical protein
MSSRELQSALILTVRERERESERARRKTNLLDDCDASGSTGTLAVNRSGRAVLKEGAVVAVGESSPQEEKTDQRRRHEQRPQKEGVVRHR